MPDERHAARASDPARTLFTSAAYASESDRDVTEAAAAWLEEQALHPFIRETAERTLETLALAPGERVLDVGCGTGVLLPAFAAAVGETGRVVGLDHSEAFLEQARGRVREARIETTVTLARGDAHRLPFDDHVFDAGHTERVLMHLEDPDAALRELVRVVRPGGRIVSAEVHPIGAMTDHPDHELVDRLSRTMVGQMRNPWIGLELRRRFVRAGLATVRVQVVVDVEDALDPAEGAEFRTLADGLVERGEIDRPRADDFVDAMAAADAHGMHCAYALMFVAHGTVPG